MGFGPDDLQSVRVQGIARGRSEEIIIATLRCQTEDTGEREIGTQVGADGFSKLGDLFPAKCDAHPNRRHEWRSPIARTLKGWGRPGANFLDFVL